ncbi:MAG: hypothetical protein RL628_317 [Actinomycetota bacterium]|jgi:uncharacterized repeat protein (TIGR03847 family)
MDFFADFDFVDVITAGAIGEPGRRTFYIQARAGARTVTIRSEKQQVAAIGKYLRRALAHLPVPEGQPPRSVMQLAEPVQEAFVLGAIALEFNRSNDEFVLHLKEFAPLSQDDDEDDLEEDDDDDDDSLENASGSRARVSMTRAQAMAFCDNADRIVSAGRPDCEYCELPINPDGHFCPRMN